VSKQRRCGAEYVLGLGAVSYQVIQSVVYCSLTLHRSQDREIGSRVISGVDAACLASSSASLFPGMLVWPGTQCMVITVLLARRFSATSLMFQVVSCPGPRVRKEALVMAAWLSVKV
jgi:hypothetical protein